ncbi:tetraacyldisaccharide 4'-kinase [Bacteroidota bacterium]
MDRLISILLLPFALIFDVITRFRNLLYEINVFKTIEFEIPIISVGNIRVGGTGKTPFAAYMVDLISKKSECSTLSRGYGRKTEGFLEVFQESLTKSVGDEALMLKKRFGDSAGVYVCEDRAYAIPHILYERPQTRAIILDDAFQHRRVNRDLNILLSDYSHPFYEDNLMPSGRLREGRYAVKRADCIVITKCPDSINGDERQQIITSIQNCTDFDTPVFFSSIKYQEPVPVFHKSLKCGTDIILFTGIAEPKPLLQYVESEFNLIDSARFPDHHEFSLRNLKKLIRLHQKTDKGGTSFVCTEKDMVRLFRPEIVEFLKEVPVFYIPIDIKMIECEGEFASFVWKKIENIHGVN